MKYLFSVLDKVSGVYAPPFVALSAGAAKRQFAEAVNAAVPDNPLNKYHDDFSLVYFGEFDEIGGLIISLSRPEHVCNGADVYQSVVDNRSDTRVVPDVVPGVSSSTVKSVKNQDVDEPELF